MVFLSSFTVATRPSSAPLRLSSQNPSKPNKRNDIYVPFSFIGLSKIETPANVEGRYGCDFPSCAILSEATFFPTTAIFVDLKLAVKGQLCVQRGIQTQTAQNKDFRNKAFVLNILKEQPSRKQHMISTLSKTMWGGATGKITSTSEVYPGLFS